MIRRLAAVAMLTCAGAQVAPVNAALATLLAIASHASPHSHSVSLVAEHGHVHLVLSHEEEHDHGELARTHAHEFPASLSGRDHVLDLASDVPASATSRRASPTPLAVASGAAASFVPLPPIAVLRPSAEPRARDADLLTTVVLRI